MGAWGSSSFENDDAADFLLDIESWTDLAQVESALHEVADLPESEYLEAPPCSIALAAAEIVAAALGAPSADLPKEVQEWVLRRRVPAQALQSLALRATQRIASKSELKDLWDESAHAAEWAACVNQLQARLARAT